ncbi:MAG: hypothetical protein HOO06_02795 [Bdellovibrionaceae bacterium]|nr:hypothetical protein [Pseudobdellovibrionaceae bacterium]
MITKFNALLSKSGGLSYHLKSFSQKKNWNSYTIPLNKWLMSWPVKKKQLVLIAPSAGYSLTNEFLNQFHKIIAIDPDPISPLIFKHRLSHPNIQWIRKDYFFMNNKWNESALNHISKDFPHAQYLLCNFLGQIPVLKKRSTSQLENLFAQLQMQVSYTFSSALWASYHDLYSSENPEALFQLVKQHYPSLSATFQQDFFIAHSPAKKEALCQATDHYTTDLFQDAIGLNKKLFLWHIHKNYFHLIEGVFYEEKK